MSVENTTVLKCLSLQHLFTKIRDKDTKPEDFRKYSMRLMTILTEESLVVASNSVSKKTITTPTGAKFDGIDVDTSNMVAVSIIRAGDSLLECFLNIVPEAAVGKILIQRNEETAEPVLFYDKLPPLENKQVMLLDPMLATGGSAMCAIDVLINKGAKEENILFVNVVCCPEGLKNLSTKFPKIKVVTACIDECLNEKKYIMPGLGDYGDRFFNSV